MAKKKVLTDQARSERADRVLRPMLRGLGIIQQYEVSIGFTDKLVGSHRAGSLATVNNDYPYRRIEILCVRPLFDALTDEGVEQVILHETLHNLVFGRYEYELTQKGRKVTQPMRDAEEESIDRLTIMFMRMADQAENRWFL